MSNPRWDLDELVATVRRHDVPPAGTAASGWAALEEALAAGRGPTTTPARADLASHGAATTHGLGAAATISSVVVAVVAVLGLAAVLRNSPLAPDSRPKSTAPTPASAPVDPGEHAAEPIVEEPFVLPVADPGVVVTAERVAEQRPNRDRQRPRRLSSDQSSPAPSDSTSGSKPDALAEQARLLGLAWQAVNRGDATEALELVRRHALRFPQGPFGPEREACRVVAQCVRGDRAAAEQASAHLRRYPLGPYVRRIETACDVTARAETGDESTGLPATQRPHGIAQ